LRGAHRVTLLSTGSRIQDRSRGHLRPVADLNGYSVDRTRLFFSAG
jgi:hypothetical protein